MSKVVINEKEELVKLDGLKIRDRQMIPEYTIVTNKVVETQTDAKGNVLGYINRVERLATITLKPPEFYKIWKQKRKKVGKDAKENGATPKTAGKEKGAHRQEG